MPVSRQKETWVELNDYNYHIWPKKKKKIQSIYIGTFDFKKGSTPKILELKSWNAGLLMENSWLSLGHRKLKTGKDFLRVDDETKSPPSFPWTQSLLLAGQVKKAMMVQLGSSKTLNFTKEDGSSFWLLSLHSSVIAVHACCRISRFTTNFANSNPLLKLPSWINHRKN